MKKLVLVCAIAFGCLSVQAHAGNYDPSGSGFGNHGIGGVNANPSMRPGWCCGSIPNTVSSSGASNFGTALNRAFAGIAGWFSGPRTSLGTFGYSSGYYGSGGIGYSGGQMETESRGSGVKAW